MTSDPALSGLTGTIIHDEIVPARAPRPVQRHKPWVASLPYRMRFYASGLYISPLAPALIAAASSAETIPAAPRITRASDIVSDMSSLAAIGLMLLQIGRRCHDMNAADLVKPPLAGRCPQHSATP